MKKYFKTIMLIILSLISGYTLMIYMRIPKQGIIFVGISIIIYCLLKYFKKNKLDFFSKNTVILWVYSILFSISLICGCHLKIHGNIYTNTIKNSYMTDFNFIDIFGLIILSIIIFIIISLLLNFLSEKLKKINIINKSKLITKKSNWIKISLLLFILWLPYFFIYYPGLIFGDSTLSILQSMGIIPFSNHHPILYTLFIKSCIKFGFLFNNNITLGLSIYTIIQMIYLSLSLGYSIDWLRNKGISKIVCIFLILLYGIVPFFANQSIAMWKDPMFSASILLLTIFLYDFISSDGKIMKNNKLYGIKIIILMFMVIFLRNNGIYIIITIEVILIIFYILKKIKNINILKDLIISIGLIIIFTLIIQNVVYKKIKIKEPFVESIGIMLNQMSSVVTYNGNMNNNEKEYMNNLLPLEKYKYTYRPNVVDKLKWNVDFDEEYLENDKKKFFKTYFSLLVKNPYQYFKAYTLNTYGYWIFNRWELNTVNTNITQGSLNDIKKFERILNVKQKNLLKNEDLKTIFTIKDSFISLSIINWFILLIVTIIFMKKQIKYLLPMMPSIGLILTLLIATPHAYWQRYGLAEYYLLPIYILIFICVLNCNIKKVKNT